MKPEAKHPIILPRKHHVTKVLVEHYHRRNGHVGAEHVLSLVREKYWIIGGRIIMNQVVSQCFFCRVRRAKRQFPYMADLPKCRAAVDQPPFSHCGCDLFGPVQIKQGRKKLKRWVVLFTCLTVRSIHLEVYSRATQILSYLQCEGSPTVEDVLPISTPTMVQTSKELATN